MTTKKRHHFVPKAYLKAFADAKGRVLAYRKEEPRKALYVDPDATGFERHYYAQPMPEGGIDHNRLKDMFSNIESLWPSIAERISKSANVNNSLLAIFEFMLLQRVRVPASRDATEARLASHVHQLMVDMAEKGQLPPLPPALTGRLNEVVVSIDPHQSIHGMVGDVLGARSLIDSIGLCAIHNRTDVPFLTSDNPVIWFDPSLPFVEVQPYAISPGGPAMLLFPVSPTTILVGTTDQKNRFNSQGLWYGETADEDWIFRANAEICRFAYKTIYASKSGHEEVVEAFADESPVWQHDGASGKLVFGERQAKPKWSPRDKEGN